MQEFDICKKFTQREINTKYFSNMLKYDPFNYSFTKTAQFVEAKSLYETFMCSRNYSAELNLLNKIYKYWEIPLEIKDNIDCPILKTINSSIGIIDINILPDTQFTLYDFPKWKSLALNSLSSVNDVIISYYNLLKVLFPS